MFVCGSRRAFAVGRAIGCLLAGLGAETYGIPTGGGWGWDFGDGIPRHPVQLYEFGDDGALPRLCAVVALAPRAVLHAERLLSARRRAMRCSVSIWEFLEPYGHVLDRLNIFQLLCLALIGYSAFMIGRGQRLEPAAA